MASATVHHPYPQHSHAQSTAIHSLWSGTNDLHVPRNTLTKRPLPMRSMTTPSGGPHLAHHGRIHRRSDSGSSLLSASGSIISEYNNRAKAAERIKPILRKISLRDDDAEQGRIDLSRPSADDDLDLDMGTETDPVSGLGLGLGIHDFAPINNNSRCVSDVSFMSAVRRRRSTTHRRTTSLSSVTSHPHPLRSTQSAIQSIRHTSNPYTPPSAFSTTTFPHSEDEIDESADILADDLQRTSVERWSSRRTPSVTSAPYTMTLHLSHTRSATSLSKLPDTSPSNLSTTSVDSNISAQDFKPARSSRNTATSFDLGTSASSRTSFDRAVGFLSRTSEPEEPSARAANIRAARRAFEEREAAKERKMEKTQMKRRDTADMKQARKDEFQRRRSEASDDRVHRRRSTNTHSTTTTTTPPREITEPSEKAVAGTEYSRHSPVNRLSLPVQGLESGASTETRVKTEVSKTKAAKGVWVRFCAWSKTRMLSCY